MLAGDHERVAGEKRRAVKEGDHVTVAVDLAVRGATDDGAEDAGGDPQSVPPPVPRIIEPKRPCGGEPVIQQLRIYEIFDHNKAAFHARFRDHAQRIMRGYGFRIVAMWETKNDGRSEFAYLLTWPDLATKERAWRGFLADAEWKEIKRVTNAEHGDLVGEIQDRVLVATSYSPTLVTA